jgi:hypothetical protein
MRLTVPHYFDFGVERMRIGHDLVRPGAWDAARESEGPFGLPAGRADWEARGTDPALRARAADIVTVARGLGVRRLCSYGVGTALLELQLHRAAPDIQLVCVDYAPKAVARLRQLFPEADVQCHDLLASGPLPGDLHLLSRVDTEFRTHELRSVLSRFVEPVLLVPGRLLDMRLLARELYLRFFRSGATRAGWVRTESALRALWEPTHESESVRIGAEPAYLLRRRSNA